MKAYKGIQSELDKAQGIIRKLILLWLRHNKTNCVLAVPEESSVRVGVSLVPEYIPLGAGISGGTQLNMEEALA